MVLSNLSRILDKYESQLGIADSNIFDSLKGLPFYNWDSSMINPAKQAQIDFNHAIGLPRKDDVPCPLFDYEQMLYDTLQSNKHVWIKKATGLGVTEFMLRYMAWLCANSSSDSGSNHSHRILNLEFTNVSNNHSQRVATLQLPAGSQMCIVTGPRIELAITLIDRMKGLFKAKNIALSDSKETVIELNGVHIEAYPSHHLDAMRGLTNVSFIYLDEADFFPPGQQQDARDVSERYIGKTNPWIVMVSTPNAPEQLFDRMEHEPEETCLYKRLFLDYTYGLNRISSLGCNERVN